MNNNIEVLNDALALINEIKLPENKLFVVKNDFHGDNFTRVECSITNKAHLIIDFSNGGIDLHIDGASEAFSWGTELIKKERKLIIDKFVMILTSKIRVISYGKSYKEITFESCEKNITHEKLRIFDGLFFNPFRKKIKCYPAFIEKCNK
ncbi:hypothetical protein [Rheinheimera sp. F8]|uniref:hypothetical protein n=1 Tax=Rheinheimera sp. F8 TaxID=1763998 RepID=UPI000744AA56|nr:hypothetical protein [Rheinheimera sp. F8]ALZ74865.1 hypothetical protein ATY27_03230 [Rheinheimera sp. F8]